MRTFRLLTAAEIECRIGEISKKGKGLSLLLYKTARTDAALLDEVYPPERWQNDYKNLDGRLYGGIGIKFGDEWVWRWDCGTESNMEADKGRASDAFKRAGFKWGIGVELYTSPRIYVYSDKCKIEESNGKYKCYDTFEVKSIGYDDAGNINKLQIVNKNTGGVCFTMGENKVAAEQKAEASGNKLLCSACNAEIEQNVNDYSIKNYGKPLCRDCQKKAIRGDKNV